MNERSLLWAVVLAVGLMGAGCTKQARTERHLKRATSYVQEGQLDKAEIEYRNAIRLQPTNVASVVGLGNVHYDQGRFITAAQLFMRAKALDTNNVKIRLRTAQLQSSFGVHTNAMTDALFVLSQAPEEEEAYLVLANAARMTNQAAEVRRWFEQLGRTAATNQGGYHLALARLALARGESARAEEALKRAEALAPNSPNLQLTLAGRHWAASNLVAAEAAFKRAYELSPVRSQHRLRYPEFKLRTRARDEARSLLEEMLKAAPDYVPAQVFLFDIAMQEARYDDAQALVRKVLARDTTNFEALLMAAQIQVARGKPTEALKELDRANTVYPNAPIIHYRYAVAHLLNRDTVKAMASLDRAIALEPNYTEAILLLAELERRAGKVEEAITLLGQLIRKQPRLVQAHLALAEAYRTRGTLDEALNVYRRLEQEMPREPQLPYLVGVTLREQNKGDEAVRAFERSLVLNPDGFPALRQLVELHLAAGRISEAQRVLDGPLRRHAKTSSYRVLLALTQVAAKQTEQAEETLLQTVVDDPDARDAYILLSQMYVRGGKPEEALGKLETLAARRTNDVAALLLIGMLTEQMDQPDRAKSAYEKVIALSPRSAAAMNNLAYLYSERYGRHDEAFELARKARELAPGDPYTADTLAWVAYRRGEYAWALNLLEESAQRLPDEPEIQYHLGMTHYMLGEEGPARAALSKALQTTRDFRGKAEARETLLLLDGAGGKLDRQTLQALEKRLEKNPNDAVLLNRLAAGYVQEGDAAKAARLYETAIKANSKPAGLKVRLARLEVEQLGNPARAMELVKAAHALEPDDAFVTQEAGRVASLAGDHGWAFGLLQEAVRRAPAQPDLLFLHAQTAYALGRVSEAQASLRAALQVIPPSAQAKEAEAMQRWMSLATNGVQAAQSLEALEVAARSEPVSLPVLMALGVAHEQRGDWGRAWQAYERALTASTNFTPAARGLALLAARRGTNEVTGLRWALQAQAALPGDPELGWAAGILLYRRGEYGRALPWLKETAGRRSTDPELLYVLGMTHHRLREKAEAKQALQKAVGLGLAGEEAREAARVLAELK